MDKYHSSTHGPIDMTFEGRRLMQNLRYAIQLAINARNWDHNDKAVSKARGDLAQYISELERDRRSLEWRRTVDAAKNSGHPLYSPVLDDRTTPDHQMRAGLPVVHTGNTYVLPKIPKGYQLQIVGGIVSIAPIQEITGG